MLKKDGESGAAPVYDNQKITNHLYFSYFTPYTVPTAFGGFCVFSRTKFNILQYTRILPYVRAGLSHGDL